MLVSNRDGASTANAGDKGFRNILRLPDNGGPLLSSEAYVFFLETFLRTMIAHCVSIDRDSLPAGGLR